MISFNKKARYVAFILVCVACVSTIVSAWFCTNLSCAIDDVRDADREMPAVAPRGTDDGLERRKARAKELEKESEGIGTCERCNMPWTHATHHVTMYSKDEGVFALCETCFDELTPEERWPFYEKVVNGWETYGFDRIDDIKRAVLEGK